MTLLNEILLSNMYLAITIWPKNVNLLNNSGVLAGQVVMHFHMHIIPRYENDEFKVIQPSHEPDFNELDKLKDLLNS